MYTFCLYHECWGQEPPYNKGQEVIGGSPVTSVYCRNNSQCQNTNVCLQHGINIGKDRLEISRVTHNGGWLSDEWTVAMMTSFSAMWIDEVHEGSHLSLDTPVVDKLATDHVIKNSLAADHGIDNNLATDKSLVPTTKGSATTFPPITGSITALLQFSSGIDSSLLPPTTRSTTFFLQCV